MATPTNLAVETSPACDACRRPYSEHSEQTNDDPGELCPGVKDPHQRYVEPGVREDADRIDGTGLNMYLHRTRKPKTEKAYLEKISLEGVVHGLMSTRRSHTMCGIDMEGHHCIEMQLRCFCLGCRTRSLQTDKTITCMECIVVTSEHPELELAAEDRRRVERR